MSIHPWENYISIDALTESQLKEKAVDTFPKAIMSAEKNRIKNPFSPTRKSNPHFVSKIGSSLTSNEINNFSDFTIETFYKVHANHYPISEIEVFKAHQAVFFTRPFHYMRHELSGDIAAYLVVGMLENHPFFKDDTWHIGYWGMASTITDKNLRAGIKHDWGTLLKDLNSSHRIAGNIDYFNKPAFKMASEFGMKIHGYRFDPRE